MEIFRPKERWVLAGVKGAQVSSLEPVGPMFGGNYAYYGGGKRNFGKCGNFTAFIDFNVFVR